MRWNGVAERAARLVFTSASPALQGRRRAMGGHGCDGHGKGAWGGGGGECGEGGAGGHALGAL